MPKLMFLVKRAPVFLRKKIVLKKSALAALVIWKHILNNLFKNKGNTLTILILPHKLLLYCARKMGQILCCFWHQNQYQLNSF